MTKKLFPTTVLQNTVSLRESNDVKYLNNLSRRCQTIVQNFNLGHENISKTKRLYIFDNTYKTLVQ